MGKKQNRGVQLDSPEQTDFGKIYYKNPSKIEKPKNLKSLAKILKKYNDRKIPVTIRGSGNSMNGQSLTDGVQIDLSSLSWTHFNEKERKITVGAGTTCHEVWEAMSFPKYSLPVFIAFPFQNIGIGGILAAGGVGYYSIRNGGMWNWVDSIKLVTMTGEIINCSRSKNSEYLQYSMGGYGRIGVIGEITLNIVPSPKYVSVMNNLYLRRKNLFENVIRSTKDKNIDGLIIGQGTGSFSWFPWLRFPMKTLISLSEKVNLDKESYKDKYGRLITNFRNEFFKEEDGSIKRLLSKKRLIYYTPSIKVQSMEDKKNFWINIEVGMKNYQKLNISIDKITKKYGLQHKMIYDTLPRWKVKAHFRIFGLVMKNNIHNGFDYPLLEGLSKKEEYSFGMSLFFTLNDKNMDYVIAAIKEIVKKTYELKGKQYPSCYYFFEEGDLRRQYGENVLNHWSKIKKKLDPNNLLNIGVIEHLDNWRDFI